MRAKQAEWQGPTAERLMVSDGHVVVGDDQQGGRVYHFKDSALARVYSRIRAHARTDDQRRNADAEERALERYFTAYIEGGMLGNVSSVDCNRTGTSSPSGRDHTAKTDWQIDHRAAYYQANHRLSLGQKTVLKVVVITGSSLENAGYAIGHRSQRRAIANAEIVLRGAANELMELWGI